MLIYLMITSALEYYFDFCCLYSTLRFVFVVCIPLKIYFKKIITFASLKTLDV